MTLEYLYGDCSAPDTQSQIRDPSADSMLVTTAASPENLGKTRLAHPVR
jgi:hypothetical protein